METIISFLSFLLLELPARAIALFPESPGLMIALALVIVLLLLVLMRRARRRRRRRRR